MFHPIFQYSTIPSMPYFEQISAFFARKNKPPFHFYQVL